MTHNTTKEVIVTTFKELVHRQSLSAVKVSDICIECSINRKSFYYYFKDKYDLICSIFRNEFIYSCNTDTYDDIFDFLLDMCTYFENNKKFYRKVFKCNEENPFSIFFADLLFKVSQSYLDKAYYEDDKEFYIDFFADALFNSIRKWICSDAEHNAYEFVTHMRKCVFVGFNEEKHE